MAITDWQAAERPRGKLLDHFIVAGNTTLSFSERGLL